MVSITIVYSSLKIKLAVKENINFYVAHGMIIVYLNTINRFRSNKLQANFKEIFKQVVLMFYQ